MRNTFLSYYVRLSFIVRVEKKNYYYLSRLSFEFDTRDVVRLSAPIDEFYNYRMSSFS